MKTPKTVAILLALVVAVTAAPGQAQPALARVIPRSFEVASIKPNQSGSESRRATTTPGGRFSATNVSLKQLISRAYGVPEAQIQGGPSWIDTERYDVAAKADTPLEMSREEVRPCLQALLADRFHLTVHRETRQAPLLSLTTAKNGPKFKAHSGDGLAGMSASNDSGRAVIEGTKSTTARLAEYLSGFAGRPVIDNTGLKGEYDFRLQWSTDESSSGPSIFDAIQEQLGLRLSVTKGPAETIVVDRAVKASAN